MAAPTLNESTEIVPFFQNLTEMAEFVDCRSIPSDTEWADIDNVVLRIGATTFPVPGLSDTPDEVKCIEGVMIDAKRYRVHYKGAYVKGQNAAPDCVSHDMEHGVGNPGGACATCPMIQWANYKRPDGKFNKLGCQKRMYIYVLTAELGLPLRIKIPPTSIRNMDAFFTKLKKHKILPWQIVCKLQIIDSKIVISVSSTKLGGVELTEIVEYRKAWSSFKAAKERNNGIVETETANTTASDEDDEKTFSKKGTTAAAKTKSHIDEDAM